MPDHLVFVLEARMASFGDLAGHERRGSFSWPGRSALIGLLGAALGMRRDDDGGLGRLQELSFAVAAHETGSPLRDYHTVQTIHQKVRRPRTRASAMVEAREQDGLNTTITLRDYHCDVLYSVAAWGGAIDLDEIAAALKRPAFTLYLGRKSCPLSAPVNPRRIAAQNPVEALGHSDFPPWRVPPAIRFVASDPFPGIDALPHTLEWRHDEPSNRGKWHFSARQAYLLRRVQQ